MTGSGSRPPMASSRRQPRRTIWSYSIPTTRERRSGGFPSPGRRTGNGSACRTSSTRCGRVPSPFPLGPQAEPGLPRDTAALQIVTVRSPLLVEAVETTPEGDYSEAYFLHGFGVRLAEAGGGIRFIAESGGAGDRAGPGPPVLLGIRRMPRPSPTSNRLPAPPCPGTSWEWS